MIPCHLWDPYRSFSFCFFEACHSCLAQYSKFHYMFLHTVLPVKQSVVKDTTQQGPLLFHQGDACQRICGDGHNTTRVAYCFCAAVMPVRESVVTDTTTEESGKHTKSHGPFLLKDCLSESAVTDTTQEALPVQPTFYKRLLHATVGIKFPTTRF